MIKAEKKNVGRTALVFGAVAACNAMPASANINRVDGLNQNIAANTTFTLDVDGNGSTDLNLSNVFAYAGSDYWGNTYYNRSVSIGGAGAGGSVSGLQAAPGALIGPATPMAGSALLDSTSASFYSTQVGIGGGYYVDYACGKYTCTSYVNPYPIYGTAGTYTANNPNLGNNLLFGFQFLNGGGQTRFGWLDLSISNPNTQTAYGFTLNGYGWDDSGAAVAAGAVATVPEPSNLMLMAFGALGIAAYRRKMHQRH